MLKSIIKLLRDAAEDLSSPERKNESDDPLEPAYAGANPDMLSDVALRHTKRAHCRSGMMHQRCEDVVDLRFREIHSR